MGCFSVCCSMSKMTINAGDKVLLIPLIPVGPAGGYMYLSTMDLFMPFCLPIVGTYDDYGSIENIEKNINTEILEKYFKIEETKTWEDIFFIKGRKLNAKVKEEEISKYEGATYSS